MNVPNYVTACGAWRPHTGHRSASDSTQLSRNKLYMNKVMPSSSTYKASLIYHNTWLLYIYLTRLYKIISF